MCLRLANPLLRRGICLLLLCVAGCASSGKKWYDPFGLLKTNENEEPKIKVTTSAERIKILRNLAKIASSMQPAEQERATDELCLALPKEEDILVRAQMLRTIALFPSPRAEAMLKAGLRDADQDVRVACCDAWGSRGGSEANRMLCETLTSDTDLDVRLAAARALGVLKDSQSVPALTLALDDQNPAIQYRAMQSLKAVTGKNYKTVKEWREYAHGDKAEPASLAGWLRRLF